MKRRVVQGFFSFLILIYCNLAYGQAYMLTPEEY